MKSSRENQLLRMINSSAFTPQLMVHYLPKKSEDLDVLDNLIMRLYSFSDQEISGILMYLM